MEPPSFDELATVIRKAAMLPPDERVRPDTQFERDLGITGDDGGELMQAVERHFNVRFPADEEGFRKSFGLEKNEYLFNSEGFPLWELLPFVKRTTVRAFTAGELHEAILKVLAENVQSQG